MHYRYEGKKKLIMERLHLKSLEDGLSPGGSNYSLVNESLNIISLAREYLMGNRDFRTCIAAERVAEKMTNNILVQLNLKK